MRWQAQLRIQINLQIQINFQKTFLEFDRHKPYQKNWGDGFPGDLCSFSANLEEDVNATLRRLPNWDHSIQIDPTIEAEM